MNASDMRRLSNVRTKIEEATFEKIVSFFMAKIKHAASYGNRSCVVSVPPTMLGHPTYDVYKGAEYVERRLTDVGYIVSNRGNATLFIDWDVINN